MELVHPVQARTVGESELWQTYGRRIFGYLLRLTGQRETAEDLTQETFLLAIRSRRRSPQVPENEAAWLFRIATNQFRDYWRRRRLISWLPFLPDRDGGAAADTADLVVEQAAVALVLRQLPPDTAAMLLLKDGEGFSTREIAAMFGLEYEAARKRLARARVEFRRRYAQLEEETR